MTYTSKKGNTCFSKVSTFFYKLMYHSSCYTNTYRYIIT